MKKVLRRSVKGGCGTLTLRVLDLLDVSVIPESEHIRPASVAASVLCDPKSAETSATDVVCTTLYVYLLENQESVLSSLRSGGVRCSVTDGACTPHQRKIRNIFASDVWCLPHTLSVLAASWNRNSASKVNKLLVSITQDMIACVWRIGPSTSHELLMNIDIGENTFTSAVAAYWMEYPMDVTDYMIEDRCFVIFYESRVTSKEVVNKRSSTDHEASSNIVNNGDKICVTSAVPSGTNSKHREQVFKIFSLDGICSMNGNPNADCVISHRDIEFPMLLKQVKSVKLCSFTMETGLLTVYTSDTMRPKKVCPKSNFQVSNWVTMISRSVKSDVSEEAHEDLIGSQIMLGRRKLVPPCVIYAVNEIGLDVQILLTPCDIFLKDWNPRIGDKVLGLVTRYICHVSSSFFVKSLTSKDGNAKILDIEQSIIERYKSLNHVKEVVSFHDHDCYVVLVLYLNGTMDVFRTSSTNPGFGRINELKIKTIARINAVKVLSQDTRIVFMMFVVDIRGVSLCNIYSWESASISLLSSWQFHHVPSTDVIIEAYDVWYEGGPTYLVSPCILSDNGNSDTGATNIYLIDGSDIRHWLRISGDSIEDLITGNVKKHMPGPGKLAYSLDGDKLICNGERVCSLPLLGGDDAMVDELPVYHPRYIKAFLDLGLRRLVDELICLLVDAYRDFLNKLTDTSTCNPNKATSSGCDCVIIKTEHIKVFFDLNRSFSVNLLRTFAGLISRDPFSLFGEPVKNTNMESYKQDDGIPLNELILFLQYVRLPGLLWREQIDLMDTLQTLRPKAGSEVFLNKQTINTSCSGSIEKASNFFLLSEKRNSKEFDIYETLDFKMNIEADFIKGMEVSEPVVTCPLVLRAEDLLKRGSGEEVIKAHRTNDKLASLTLPSKLVNDEFCLWRYLDHIKYDFGNEGHVVWAMLYWDDLNLFQIVLSMLETGDDMIVSQRILSNMQSLGLGYWIHSQACVEKLCSTLERGFRKLIATTEAGGNVEALDEFGFWSILRNKPLVYGCVLTAKGFQRLGEFLSNDFTQEKWKQIAVKNAYALIAKKRYLLAAGFLVLADRLEDAVDVCFQYIKDPQLACLICKVRQHDLGYALNLMEPSSIREVLSHKLGMSSIVPMEVSNVENLVYYLYTGIRYRYVTEEVMMETIKSCAAKYRAQGMPLVSIMLDSLIIEASEDKWKHLVSICTLRYLLTTGIGTNGHWQQYLKILKELCEQSLEKGLSSISNLGSDEETDNMISTMDWTSDADAEKNTEALSIMNDPEHLNIKAFNDDNFHIRLVSIISNLKKELGMDVSIGFGVEKVSFSPELFETVSRLPDYFSQLCKICVGFLEGQSTLDGNMLVVLIMHAIIKRRNDLPSCLILSVASLLATACFDRGVIGQVYDAFLGQLVMLNSLLNNQSSGDQFLTCLLRVMEPLCFGSPGHRIESQPINTLHFLESSQKHAFFGMCIGSAILEMIVTLCRSWIYSVTETSEQATQSWVDRIIHAASLFLFSNAKSRMMEDALAATGIVFPMLSLRVGLETPVDCKVRDEEFHVYDSFLERYVASLYGNEFEKLWRLLHCGFRVSNLFSNHPHNGASSVAHRSDACCNALDLDRNKVAAPASNKPLPLIIPVSCMFSTAQTWNGEYVTAQANVQNKETCSQKPNCAGSSAVLESLRERYLMANHTFKGRMLSNLYFLPSTSSYNGCPSLTAKGIVEPVLNDLYMMVMLNLNGSGKLSQLSNVFTNAIVNEVFTSVVMDITAACSYAIYVRFMKAIATYCRNHLDNIYQINKPSKLTRIAERILRRFRLCDKTKEYAVGGPSGGICGHPTFPIYAVVYGENPYDRLPAYSVTLEHSAVLLKDSKEGMEKENTDCGLNLVYDISTSTHMNVGQGSVFGDLNSLGWTGDHLLVYDKNGWMLIYYLKNMNYVNAVGTDIAVPSISFKAHSTGYVASWITETYVVTLGNGILPENMTHEVKIVDTNSGDISTRNSGYSVNHVQSGPYHDSVDNMHNNRSDKEDVMRKFREMQVPCVCVWDLMELNKNNTPKLKFLIANGSITSHSMFNKKKHAALAVKFTCVLPIPSTSRGDGPSASRMGYDLVIFDSQGMMMHFSEANEEVTWVYKAHTSAVIKCFYVRGRIVTVGQDGSLGMFTLNGPHAEPTRVFDGVARTSTRSQDSVSSGNIVTSIGEYLGIKFVDNSKDTVANVGAKMPDILDAQIVKGQFLVLTTVDGASSVTELVY